MSSSDPALIVALDFPGARAALALAEQLDPAACRVKVGLELFTEAGPAVVDHLHRLGLHVFLDLKFHDIPHTVARACARACALGVWMINVHALGGPRMLEAARDAVPATTKLIGVTVLTSHSEQELAALGLGGSAERVRSLARSCSDAGLDGVVCSPREARLLRGAHGPRFALVTPGIRLEEDPRDDQRRTLGVTEALLEGATYLVVGRPITQAPDPRVALQACVSLVNQVRK